MKLFRLFKWMAVALVAIVAIVAVAIVLTLRASLPPTSGEHRIPGLEGPVEIRFDAYERPYVSAETLGDALAAEGWLHAKHRLWQMELFRRAGKGRLSELLGSGMLESDEELWRKGVPQLARELEENAKDDMRRYVDRYVSGVNAAIASYSAPPPEFLLLQATPEPWTAHDVYAMGALMAFQSANNAENELLRLALFNELGQDAAAIFLTHDGMRNDFPYVMPWPAPVDSAKLIDAIDRFALTDAVVKDLMPSFGFGSNGWVVAPERSANGNALFAFDSHDSLGLPNLFYEVHLFFEDGKQIRGWSVAGLPGVINGYNERIAWGFTNIGDSQDLFLETRSPDDPRQFKDGDTWYTAETETVQIPVNGRDNPEELTVVYTKNGPLISDDPPIALRWSVQDLDGLGIDTILEFNRAQNWEDYTDALDRFAAPPLNATYADIDGTIGFRTAGLLPVRGAGEGLLPLAGDEPANRWQGFVPMNELPELTNPSSGFLAAANARVNADGNGPLISADNAPGYRIERIRDVLEMNDAMTLDDMQALQFDFYDGQAARLLPVMLDTIASAQLDARGTAARGLLEEWQLNPIASGDSAAAMIFQAWYRHLPRHVFAPRMSDDLFERLYKKSYPINHALDELILRETNSDWWQGDRLGKMAAALKDALAEIESVQGADVAAWRLDAMHTVTLEHELGKAVPQLGGFFNSDTEAFGGSNSTVGRARYRYDRAYSVTGAATVRVIGDMASPAPAMEAVIPGGQSGHPLSPHYVDQFNAWLNGKTVPISNSTNDLEFISALTLEPMP